MKIFLDTANVEEIRQAAALGVLDGVTTNPSLVAREKREFRRVIQEICEIVKGPVSAETVSLDAEGMVREGRELASWAPNIVVKVPMTAEGLKATRALAQEGIRVNCVAPGSILFPGGSWDRRMKADPEGIRRLEEAVREHLELLEAVLEGDPDRAEAAMARHVTGFERAIREVL